MWLSKWNTNNTNINLFELKFNGLCSAYANDLKLATFSGRLMQHDIDLLSGWVHENKLFLNTDKCLYLEMIAKSSPHRHCSLNYILDGNIMRKVDSFRDLVLK